MNENSAKDPHWMLREQTLSSEEVAELERLRSRDEKLHTMLAQMKTEADGRLLGYPQWLEKILNAE